MNLTDLEPQFLKVESPTSYRYVAAVAEADGITLLCPTCFQKNNGPVGTHSLMLWQPRVPQDITPGPGRWVFLGTGYGDLTLDNTSIGQTSSILVNGGCNTHFHIRNGAVEFC